jgi:hypothetical protein
MASFVIGRPITTAESTVVVDAGLRPGLHRFRLEVVDDSGLVSRPDEAVVQVQDQIVVTLAPAPTVFTPPVFTPVTPVLTPAPAPRPTVAPLTPVLRPPIAPVITPLNPLVLPVREAPTPPPTPGRPK